MIKKMIKFIILPIMFLTFLTPIAYGVSYDRDMPGFEDELPPPSTDQGTDQTVGGVSVNANDVPRIIQKLAKYLYNAVLIMSVIFILISAFYYLKAGDNPTYAKKAKSQLIYAVIGIAIALISFGVEQFITKLIQISQRG